VNNIPEKGDLVWVNFNPQSGHEQAGHRPALVISPKIYHEKSNFCIVCPITSNIQPWPWKVMLPEDSIIGGAVLVDQVRSIDRHTRKLKIAGFTNQQTIAEVLGKLGVLVGWE
jgi:mRNA interferase MazF